MKNSSYCYCTFCLEKIISIQFIADAQQNKKLEKYEKILDPLKETLSNYLINKNLKLHICLHHDHSIK